MSYVPTSPRRAALIVVPGIPHGPNSLAAGLWALSVRCPTGQLRVATMWQLIRPYASRLIRTRTRCDRKVGYEELSFIFAGMPDDTLSAMVDYLAAQPWVLDAWFVP